MVDEEPIAAIDVTSTGLVMGSKGGTIIQFDKESNVCTRMFTGHQQEVSCLVSSSANGFLISASHDGAQI